MPPLVVEGITDAVFFCELVKLHLPGAIEEAMDQPGRRGIPASVRGRRADGTELLLEFRNQDPEAGGGIGKIPAAVRGLIQDGGVVEFVVARDLDGGTPQTLARSVKGVVRNLLGGPVEDVTKARFRVQNTVLPERQVGIGQWINVGMIPMGLIQDTDLVALGVTRHTMEDYLVKILLIDETLRPKVPDLRPIIEQAAWTIRSYDVPFDSGKQILQVIKGIIQEYSDTGLIRKFFRIARRNLLRDLTRPLFEQLERAVAP